MSAFQHFKHGQPVIVRGNGSGAIFGRFIGAEQGAVLVANSVQLWEWTAAKGISLIDVAKFGVDTGKCKFSHAGGDVLITDACAIIACSDESAKSILAVKPSNS